LKLVRAPTTKAVGSEYVIKIGTDGFSRRTTKKKAAQTFETASLQKKLFRLVRQLNKKAQ
jgi:hypothetical protein